MKDNRYTAEANERLTSTAETVSLLNRARLYLDAGGAVISETLWSTRCALCDTPGSVLCDDCRRALPYLDYWQACPRCGAPYGRLICTECNSFSLKEAGWKTLPFDNAIAVLMHDDSSAHLVKSYKDADEHRLAPILAALLDATMPPKWGCDGSVITTIPASRRAMRRRGFDHMRDVGYHLAEMRGASLCTLFEQPESNDQRALNRRERFENMAGRIRVIPGCRTPESVIVIDDVFTTGATLFAASEALRKAGTQQVRCATITRVL